MATPAGDKQINEFNSQVSWLINLVRKIFPTDSTIERAIKRISLAKQANPLILLETVGPQLRVHRQAIMDHEDQFVLNMKISEETDDEMVQTIFTMLTEAYKGFKPAERTAVKNKINDMLNTYTEYLIITA